MTKPLIASLLAALLLAAGVYHQFFYAPTLLRAATDRALEDFSGVVAGKDAAVIGAALGALLEDDAQIRLDVHFFSLVETPTNRAMQDFDTPQFIAFIDNILFTLTDYSFEYDLGDFTLADDAGSAAVTFTAKSWGDGASIYSGVSVHVRYSIESVCDATVKFADKNVTLSRAKCRLELRTVPKPEEAGKITGNPQILQQILR